MQIVRDLAGYSFGRSDIVRRAMSKKKTDVMMEEKQYFIYGKTDENGNVEIPGCVRNGISVEAAEAIFADMETFAAYAFNKSHAAAYAVVAYETGYLKKYYPTEFMAALMTSVIGDPKAVAKYIRNCRDMGIEVLPPCVNESDKKFSVVGGKIRFGLLGVKAVGENVIDAIIRAREEKGYPKDIFEFISNLEPGTVNKRAMEYLIKGGALDCFSPNRAAHLAVYESLMESASQSAKKNIAGQISLFQTSSEEMKTSTSVNKLPDVKNFSQEILLSMEKEILGMYITGHPLDKYSKRISEISSVTSEDLANAMDEDSDSVLTDGMNVTIAGMITGKKTLITKKNTMMAFVDLEDMYGDVEIIVFPNVYERYKSAIAEDRVVCVRGKLNFKEDEAPKILAEYVTDIDDVENHVDRKEKPKERHYINPKDIVKVRIPEDEDEIEILEELQKIFREHRGKTPVFIYLQNGKTVKTGDGAGVYPTLELFDIIADLVGTSNIKGVPVK